MKNFYLLACCLLWTFYAQSQCDVTDDITCFSSAFFNQVNVPSQPDGINYECLGEYPNQNWFNIQVGIGGLLEFEIAQTNSEGSGLDVDYILWGPFTQPSCGPANLNPATNISCSYAVNAEENFAIENGQPGQFYTLMLANFSNLPGLITITQTNAGAPGAGSLNCDIICPLEILGAGSLCEYGNTSILLTSSIDDAESYQWTSSIAGDLMNNSPYHLVTEPATYTLTVVKEGCQTVAASVEINLSAFEHGNANNLYNCPGNSVFDLTQNTPPVLADLNPNNFTVNYFVSETDAANFFNPILNPEAFELTGESQELFFNIESLETGCIDIGSFTISTTSVVDIDFEVDGQNIAIIAEGAGPFQYSLNSGAYQNSAVFADIPLGTHTISVLDSCGNTNVVMFLITVPNAPFGDDPQYFEIGDTLADLEMSGQNIQWYANDVVVNGFMETVDEPLPLSTPLADGQTYFATQTINDSESAHRFAVTVYDSSLDNSEVVFQGFRFYPNPVTDVLSFSNQSAIKSAAVYNMLGQSVLQADILSNEGTINVSGFQSGIYFLRITSGNAVKTVKFVMK